jgi:H+/Cl- antiporter ClcA
MTNEVYNAKGEIISSGDPDEKWYQLSYSTWLLIGGLILFNIGCFVKPSVIDSLVRLLDVRLWPWWYFVITAIYTAFAIKWFLIYRAESDFDYDDMDAEAARRFKIMSMVVSVEMLVIVLLHSSDIMSTFGYSFYQWMTYGTFSWNAIFLFFVIVAIAIPTIYVLKEWFVTLFGRE